MSSFPSVPESGAAAPRTALLVSLIVLVAIYRIGVREALGLGLHFDEAQYVVWSFDPAFGYFSKPPMVAWSIWLARGACGDGEACVRLPSTLALAGATWFVFLCGRRLFDARVAFWAALIFLFAPLVSFLAWFITTDSLLLLAWAAALYCFVGALQASSTRAALGWWLLTGAVAGLGLLSKYTMGIFAVSAAGFILTSPAHRPLLRTAGPWLGGLLAAALFAPNLLWNAQHRFATFGHTAQISNLEEASVSVSRAAEFLAAQFGVFGPLAMIAFVAALLRLRRGPDGSDAPDATGRWRVALLLWFALPFLLIISGQALAARAHANWAAPTYVAASLLAAAWIARRPMPAARRWWIAVLSINIAIMLLLHGYRPATHLLGVTLARDPMTQLFGWSDAGARVAEQLAHERANDRPGRPTRLLLDDRRTMSLTMVYAGTDARDALIWNPGGRIENHYQLLRDVRGAPAGPFLLVSERDRSAELAAAFESVAFVGVLRAEGAPVDRPLYAWRLGALRAATR